MFRLQSPDGRQIAVGSAAEAVRLRASGYVDVPDEPKVEKPDQQPDSGPKEQPDEGEHHSKRRGHPATS